MKKIQTLKKYNKEEIQSYIDQGWTLDKIGKHYGVTRQRMYQVFSILGLNTLVRRKKNIVRDYDDPRKRWLFFTLHSKDVPPEKLHEIINNIELPTHCPIFGTELVYGGTPQRGDNTASIDRIKPGGPYERGNVHIISWRANRIKRQLDKDEVKKIFDYLTK